MIVWLNDCAKNRVFNQCQRHGFRVKVFGVYGFEANAWCPISHFKPVCSTRAVKAL